MRLEVGVDLRIVDHLAQQPQAFAGVLRHRFVGDLDGILHAKAESEMAGKNEADGPEVQDAGPEVPFPGIPQFPESLDLADDGRPVRFRDVESPHGTKVREPLPPEFAAGKIWQAQIETL